MTGRSNCKFCDEKAVVMVIDRAGGITIVILLFVNGYYQTRKIRFAKIDKTGEFLG